MGWQRFRDSLAISGGQTLVLFVLMLLALLSYRNGVPTGEDVIMAAFGALLGRLSAGERKS